MTAIHPQVVFTFEIILGAVLTTAVLFLVRHSDSRKRKFLKLGEKRGKEMAATPTAPALQPRAVFVDLSPKTADIVELAVEVWRLNNRLNKAGTDLPDTQKRGLESSIQKFIKFLDRNDIKFIDFTGEKYNEGMNIEVLSFEKDERVKIPVIKETVEPSILCRSVVIKKGKVIVTNN